MKGNLFSKVAIAEGNPKYAEGIQRIRPLYKKKNDIRNEFERDYTRILHSTAYRRLKHKTQVFPTPQNDHICTRMEHVNHVASVSYTIAKFLGLNIQLTAAIAIGHDLGHAPFGHAGEKVLKHIAEKEIGDTFWHEKNSLRFVDSIETLSNNKNKETNLYLTYAVRDGIISHCGEVDENAIRPREDHLDLKQIEAHSTHSPYTWEGCVVKLADKISYLGRDIEDALMLKILTLGQIRELRKIMKAPFKEINNTILIHNFIIDLCKNSSPPKGICFSEHYLIFMKAVKEFNYANIYYHPRLKSYMKYVELILQSIFYAHKELYGGEGTLEKLKKVERLYPTLVRVFSEWLMKYSNIHDFIPGNKRPKYYENEILYDMRNENDFLRAVLDYISGMTDNFAISIFEELSTFK